MFPEISRTFTFGANGASGGQYYNEHLAHIRLNDVPVRFRELDLTYLYKVWSRPRKVRRVRGAASADGRGAGWSAGRRLAVCQENYDTPFLDAVYQQAIPVRAKELDGAVARAAGPSAFRITYTDEGDFGLVAGSLGLMTDFRVRGPPSPRGRGRPSCVQHGPSRWP